jgi:hypothetical protein
MKPDYGAIARMEREIYGEILTPESRHPGLVLCGCGGSLPHHVASPHYLPDLLFLSLALF